MYPVYLYSYTPGYTYMAGGVPIYAGQLYLYCTIEIWHDLPRSSNLLFRQQCLKMCLCLILYSIEACQLALWLKRLTPDQEDKSSVPS
jgi:hypothetical protein